MVDNARKTPLQWSLNSFADGKVDDGIQNLSKGLPCSIVAVVSSCIVTVKFEVSSVYNFPQITVPVATSEYVRLPLQIGDLGRVVPSDFYLGGISGLGGGTADLVRRGNLATLVFEPVSNTGWSSVDNNSVTLYGPNGCVLRDKASKTVVTVTPTTVTITVPSGKTVTISSGGTAQPVKLADNTDSIVLMAQ